MKTLEQLFDLSGKVALVTGGSRGLGYEMVKAFAMVGASVVIVSRKLDRCQEVAREVESQFGIEAMPYACHVGHWDEIDGLVDAVYKRFGRVDILVNNAGMSPLVPSSAETTEELFDKVVSLNFKGPFRLGALIGQRMFDGEGGCIINVSSTGSIMPSPRLGPYAGAKNALNALTQVFGREFAPKVRVNTLMAGPFLTDISKAWTEEKRQNTRNTIGHPGNPEEIITSALYLASSSSSYTSLATVRCDGGLF